MKFLQLAFSESDGNPSTMRIVSALVCLAVVGTWAAVSLHKWELQPTSPEQLGLVLGSLGIKAWQRAKESQV